MATSRSNHYFMVSYERHFDRVVIQDTMQDHFASMKNLYENEKDCAQPSGPWEYPRNGLADPIDGTRPEALRAFWRKTRAAFVGAGFLIGPMWLLALKQQLYLQLGATTGFVLGFGLVMAFSVDKVDQVFASTLAYAAVLMVFVGLSLQGATGA